MSPDNEKRRYHRKTCCRLVDVDDYENAYPAKLLNLCLGGAFVEAPQKSGPAVGQELILTIPYRHKADYLVIKGRVAWRHDSGFGVAFLREAA